MNDSKQGDGANGYVTVAALEGATKLVAATTTTEILEALMNSAPGTPQFENRDDRLRLIAWLENRASDAWALVDFRSPDSDGPGDHGIDR